MVDGSAHRERLSPRHRRFILGLLCLTLVADGFDAAALAFAIPTIGAEWDVPAASFTAALVATSVGAVVGFLCSGALAQHWGRATLVWRSVLLFSSATFAAGFAGSVAVLAGIRLVAGVGFGLVLPAAVAIAGDLVAPRNREAGGMIAVLGLTVGTTIGGFVGGPLIAAHGWRSAFVAPAICGFVLVAALLAWVRPLDRVPHSVPGSVPHPSFRRLLDHEVRASTLFLWCAAFLVFVTHFLLQSWLPTLVVDAGIPTDEAPIALAALGVGGLIGAAIAIVGARMGLARVLAGLLGVAVAGLLCVGLAPFSETVLLASISAAGAGLVAAAAGLAALALRVYPYHLRTTGIGWTAAAGRVGSVVGPAIGGALVARAWAPQTIFVLAAAPALAATVLVIALAVHSGSARVTPESGPLADGDLVGDR